MRAVNLAVGLLVGLILLGDSILLGAAWKDKNTTCPLAIKTRISRRNAKYGQILTYTVKVSNRAPTTASNVHVAVTLPGHGIHYPLEEGVKRGNYSSVQPRKLSYDKVKHVGNKLELWDATLPRKGSLTWRLKVRVGGCLRDLTKPLRFRAKAFLLAEGEPPSCFVFAPKSNVTIKNMECCDETGEQHPPHSRLTPKVAALGMNLVDVPAIPMGSPLTPSQRAYRSALKSEARAAIPREDSPYVEYPETQTTEYLATQATGSAHTMAQQLEMLDILPGVSYWDEAAQRQSNPPDPVVGVGINHIVHATNNGMAVYDKATGLKVWGTIPIRTLFQGLARTNPDDPCVLRDDGDPTVEWDHKHGRFVVAQFTTAPPVHYCVAVSQTSDPTGDWWGLSYELSAEEFWDYPKMGIFRDGMVASFDRFENTDNGPRVGSAIFLLQSPPAAFTGNQDELQGHTWFSGDQEDGQWIANGIFQPGGSDVAGNFQPNADYMMPVISLAFSPARTLYVMFVFWDWAKGTKWMKGQMGEYPLVGDFNKLSCPNGDDFRCIPQPDPNQRLDSLADRLMNPLRYNIFQDAQGNFYDSMVVSHVAQVGTAGTRSGVHWYEIRNINIGDTSKPVIYQQGTYSPDSDSRFIPTIGMDCNNNIALVYSVSGAGTFPGMRAVGRYSEDPLKVMTTGELLLLDGLSSQAGFKYAYRWGDYYSMALDPVVSEDQ